MNLTQVKYSILFGTTVLCKKANVHYILNIYDFSSTVIRLQAGLPQNCGLIHSRKKGLFSSTKQPQWIWSSPSSYLMGNTDTFSRSKVAGTRR